METTILMSDVVALSVVHCILRVDFYKEEIEMKIVADLTGQNTPVVKPFNIYGAAGDMYLGDLVEIGDNVVESGGAVIAVGTPAGPAEVLGLLTQFHDYSVDGEFTYNAAMTNDSQNNMVDVDIRPGAIFRSRIKESTNTFTTAALGTACTLGTNAAADDQLGMSFVYDENGALRIVEDHSAVGTLNYNTAVVTAQAGVASTCVLIPSRLYGKLAACGMTYTKGTAAAPDSSVLVKADETVLWQITLDMFYREAGSAELHRMLPKDDATTLNSPEFYIDFVIRDHAMNPLS
jgi:hypothetical protein